MEHIHPDTGVAPNWWLLFLSGKKGLLKYRARMDEENEKKRNIDNLATRIVLWQKFFFVMAKRKRNIFLKAVFITAFVVGIVSGLVWIMGIREWLSSYFL